MKNEGVGPRGACSQESHEERTRVGFGALNNLGAGLSRLRLQLLQKALGPAGVPLDGFGRMEELIYRRWEEGS